MRSRKPRPEGNHTEIVNYWFKCRLRWLSGGWVMLLKKMTMLWGGWRPRRWGDGWRGEGGRERVTWSRRQYDSEHWEHSLMTWNLNTSPEKKKYGSDLPYQMNLTMPHAFKALNDQCNKLIVQVWVWALDQMSVAKKHLQMENLLLHDPQ